MFLTTRKSSLCGCSRAVFESWPLLGLHLHAVGALEDNSSSVLWFVISVPQDTSAQDWVGLLVSHKKPTA